MMNACGLRDQPSQFQEYGIARIRLIQHLIASSSSNHQPKVRQVLEFTLHGTVAATADPHELPEMKDFIRVAIQNSQQSTTVSAKQPRARRLLLPRTHSEYDCTLFEYIDQAGGLATHSLTLLTTDAGASTSNSTAPSTYLREKIRAFASSSAKTFPSDCGTRSRMRLT